MYRKPELVVLLVSFLTAQLLNAQNAPIRYKYCYCPKEVGEKFGGINNKVITGMVSRFDPSNIASLELTVTKSDGSSFAQDEVFFTTGSRHPYGAKLYGERMATGNSVTIKYVKALFSSKETSVAVFVTLVQQNQPVSLLGPITFYRFPVDAASICDEICPAEKITPKQDDQKQEVTDKSAQSEDPGIKAYFAKERVYPSADAVALMKALNPSTDLDNPQKPLIYPEFPPVPSADQKAYEQTFQQQRMPNAKLNGLLFSNIAQYNEMLDVVFTSKTGSDKVIREADYARFKTNLLQLGESLTKMVPVIDKVSSIVSSGLNEELSSLNNSLARIFQKRTITVALFNEALALCDDIDYMLLPYFPENRSKKRSGGLIPQKTKTGQTGKQQFVSTPRLVYSSVLSLPSSSAENQWHVDVQPNERLFYIYVFLKGDQQEAKKAVTGFKVWCKPKAYEKSTDKSHEIQVGYASVTAKGFSTSRLFFYLQKADKVYKSPVDIDMQTKLDRDDNDRKAYKLILYLSDLKLVRE